MEKINQPEFTARPEKNETIRLGTEEFVNPDTIKLVANKLGHVPDGVVVEIESQDGGKKEVFVSRYIGSDPDAGFTEDWIALSEYIDLPRRSE